ncbi:hypothetical protein DVK02_00705 [Halobellus sp. Atlit-31R]|nr:hypothetical protein DVK02_00705 [Halobellus sp. Atlit-31R]
MSIVSGRVDAETDRCTLCRRNRNTERHQGKSLCGGCERKLRDANLLGSVPTATADEDGALDAEATADLGERAGVEQLEGNRYLIVI